MRPDIMWSRARASDVIARAEQLERTIEAAGKRELSADGISVEYAEELVAAIRADRDSY